MTISHIYSVISTNAGNYELVVPQNLCEMTAIKPQTMNETENEADTNIIVKTLKIRM